MDVNTIRNSVSVFLDKIGFYEANVFLLVCLIILLLGYLYLLYIYIDVNKKILELNHYVSQSNSLGKVYSRESYDKNIFSQLLFDALDVLRTHINKIVQPYFYAKSIDEIIKIIPDYIKVMKFSKYVNDHPDTLNDAVHNLLVERYGPNYKTSPDIIISVTVQRDQFTNITYNHSILNDLSKATIVYQNNISRVKTLLQ